MFTGIVEERGDVRSIDGGRLTVACSVVQADSDIGASVAINGVCLTVVGNDGSSLSFDLSRETIDRTNLRRLTAGRPVNLERSVTLASRLGGHMVQGHVDGVGEIEEVRQDDAGGRRLRVRVPTELVRYIVEKGSITVDGVSLTVAAVESGVVTVALIPHTLAATTLGSASVGEPVNLEVDMIAKYVERLMTPEDGGRR
jgi:riboflavin synthase